MEDAAPLSTKARRCGGGTLPSKPAALPPAPHSVATRSSSPVGESLSKGTAAPLSHALRRASSPEGGAFCGGEKVSSTAQRRPLGGAGCERSEQTEGVLGLTSAAPHPTLRVTFPRRVKASVVARKFLVALDTLALRASACALSVIAARCHLSQRERQEHCRKLSHYA